MECADLVGLQHGVPRAAIGSDGDTERLAAFHDLGFRDDAGVRDIGDVAARSSAAKDADRSPVTPRPALVLSAPMREEHS